MRRSKGRSSDDDEEWQGGDEGGYRSGGSSHGTGQRARRATVQAAARLAQAGGRSRPTNNQLLYKAYFRWNHYSFKLRNGTQHLPTETDACASVTAAFLQVLHTLHVAESGRIGDHRNILQILSNNTRRTKVVELSTGTHRVPDELRKHYLSDGELGQYSTNLDRNRYGNDDQYLFTVIRYDLEYLGLCPCMVDVEIIDAKNDNQSIFVSAGPEACCCHKLWPHPLGGAVRVMAPQVPQPYGMRAAMPFMAGMPHGMPQLGHPALQMAPVGLGIGVGPCSAGAPQQQPQPCSPTPSASGVSNAFDALVMAATGGTEGAAAGGAGGEPPVDSAAAGGGGGGAAAAAAGAQNGARGAQAAPHAKQRSRLHASAGPGAPPAGADSLQHALDAFVAEEELQGGGGGASGSDATVQAGGGAAGDPVRRRQRKPARGPSSSMLGVGDSLLGSILKLGASGVITGGVADGEGEVSSGGRGAGAEGDGAGGDGAAGGPGEAGAASDCDGACGGAMSEEDDWQPSQQQQEEQEAAEEAEAVADGARPAPARHVRVVWRQGAATAAAARVPPRAGPAEVRRLAEEVEALRADNLRLSAALRGRGVDPGAVLAASSVAGGGAGAGAGARARVLERQMLLMQERVDELARSKGAAEESAARLTAELASTRGAANQVLSRLLQQWQATAAAAGAAQGAGGAAGAGAGGAPAWAAQAVAPFLGGGDTAGWLRQMQDQDHHQDQAAGDADRAPAAACGVGVGLKRQRADDAAAPADNGEGDGEGGSSDSDDAAVARGAKRRTAAVGGGAPAALAPATLAAGAEPSEAE